MSKGQRSTCRGGAGKHVAASRTACYKSFRTVSHLHWYWQPNQIKQETEFKKNNNTKYRNTVKVALYKHAVQ